MASLIKDLLRTDDITDIVESSKYILKDLSGKNNWYEDLSSRIDGYTSKHPNIHNIVFLKAVSIQIRGDELNRLLVLPQSTNYLVKIIGNSEV